MIQELYDLLQFEDDSVDVSSEVDAADAQLFLALPEAAVSGHEAPKTIRFKGHIQGQEVLILVDSGSSHTFISAAVAQSLSGVSPLPVSVAVQVANGNKMACTSQLSQAIWSVHGCSFQTDMKIIGMDRLEANCPMKVHWKQKWMSIPYLGNSAILQGMVPELPDGSVIEVCAVLVTDKSAIKLNVPDKLAELLEESCYVRSSLSEAPSWPEHRQRHHPRRQE